MSHLIGKRAQIPAFTDAWMSGDRYGTVESVVGSSLTTDAIVRVRMDRSNRLRTFIVEDLDWQ